MYGFLLIAVLTINPQPSTQFACHSKSLLHKAIAVQRDMGVPLYSHIGYITNIASYTGKRASYSYAKMVATVYGALKGFDPDDIYLITYITCTKPRESRT